MRLFGKDLNESVTISHAKLLAIATVTLPFFGILLGNYADNDWLSIAGLIISVIGLFFQGIAFSSMSQNEGEHSKRDTQTPTGTKS